MNRTSTARHARAKRASALARPELGRVNYTLCSDKLPEERRECTAWAKSVDDREPYRIPFGVMLMDSKWVNVGRGIVLEVPIYAWNYRSAT